MLNLKNTVMVFLLVWAVLLVLFLTVAVYRGFKNRKRMNKVSNKVDELKITVDEITNAWQKKK